MTAIERAAKALYKYEEAARRPRPSMSDPTMPWEQLTDFSKKPYYRKIALIVHELLSELEFGDGQQPIRWCGIGELITMRLEADSWLKPIRWMYR